MVCPRAPHRTGPPRPAPLRHQDGRGCRRPTAVWSLGRECPRRSAAMDSERSSALPRGVTGRGNGWCRGEHRRPPTGGPSPCMEARCHRCPDNPVRPPRGRLATGEPLPDSGVLWTRLAPNPIDGGGMPARPVLAAWQVATDGRFRHVIASDSVTARPEFGHSVHVEVGGLRPGAEYFYRFRVWLHLLSVVPQRVLHRARPHGRGGSRPGRPARC